MRRILFGTLLALLLTSLGCNQRPERDVPLDTSTEPLFLGQAEPCGTDSVAGWTDCDPKTNRPTRGTRTANADRVRIENTPGLRTGTPKASTSLASTKDDETSLDPADLEIGVPLWASELASEESESTSDDAFPAFWQSDNMPAFTASAALGASDAPGGSGGGGGGGGAAGGAGLGSLGSGGGGGGGSSAGQLSLPGGGNVPGVNWTDAPTPATVPEPSTIVLLATGLILLGFFRLRVNLNRTDH